ncbi:hypothetical protein EVAR_21203_1 [Eumeta japonica]|uniref:Uncharacterized protein n=1 Tax=Eumeta variegata TaxID=151549 RepID=A0A4C1UNP5_EUMVA|nr:hypothetical protein EVAR_21203_1 [Eumeta japonica]
MERRYFRLSVNIASEIYREPSVDYYRSEREVEFAGDRPHASCRATDEVNHVKGFRGVAVMEASARGVNIRHNAPPNGRVAPYARYLHRTRTVRAALGWECLAASENDALSVDSLRGVDPVADVSEQRVVFDVFGSRGPRIAGRSARVRRPVGWRSHPLETPTFTGG